jgi:hypothetical protein
MAMRNAQLLAHLSSALTTTLRGELHQADACKDRIEQLAQLQEHLAHLLETAPAPGCPVEHLKSLTVLRASVHAAVEQLEVEQAYL